jgi:hypothetical protein
VITLENVSPEYNESIADLLNDMSPGPDPVKSCGVKEVGRKSVDGELFHSTEELLE